jgi:hypothetical protein
MQTKISPLLAGGPEKWAANAPGPCRVRGNVAHSGRQAGLRGRAAACMVAPMTREDIYRLTELSSCAG